MHTLPAHCAPPTPGRSPPSRIGITKETGPLGNASSSAPNTLHSALDCPKPAPRNVYLIRTPAICLRCTTYHNADGTPHHQGAAPQIKPTSRFHEPRFQDSGAQHPSCRSEAILPTSVRRCARPSLQERPSRTPGSDARMENHQATVEGITLRPRKLSKGRARTSCSSWAPSASHAVAPGTAGGCEPRRPTHTRSPLRPWVSIRRCRQLRRLGKQRFCISDRECPTENTISDWRPVESMQREVLTVESKVMCGFLTA